MALVSYDYSSGSENEEEQPASSSSVIIPETNNVKNINNPQEEPQQNPSNDGTNLAENEDPAAEKVPALLSHLPKSKPPQQTQILEDKLEDFIPKYQPTTQPKEKRPAKVKITIPSLSQFKDDEEDEPEQKKRKSSSHGSSLLSILPPVKGSPLSTKSFVPNVLKNKPPASDKPKSSSLVPHAVRKNAEQAKQATIKKLMKISTTNKPSGSDVESDDEFEVPETFDDEMWQKVCGRKPKPKIVQEPEEFPAEVGVINIAPEPEKPYDGLDNTAFKELVGRSKRPVNIKLIDINEEEITPDTNLWLTKSLTDPDQAPKPVIDNPVDPTRKKKHHITYLAEQAKANEQELQSNWASSRYNRNQTRAKYGF